jgi:hypothetical protein
MLSSIILSLAISVSPTPTADIQKLDIQEIGKARGSLRINTGNKLTIDTVGKARGSLRINSENELTINTVGKARGSLRI